jgi:hypothetical protein
MRFRFYFFILFLSLAAAAGIYQTGLADAGGPHRIFIPMAMSGNAAPTPGTTFPNETDFVQSVINQKPDQITGVYVANVLAKQVVQQPEGSYTYISTDSKAVTQYALATMQGVTGLLAHNGLAGKTFFDLKAGQQVSMIYGNGVVRRYTITQILRYQAVEPFNYASDFIDLSNGERINVAELFARVYLGSDHVTFQTCISQNGNASWGRLFVIAEPN